MNISLSAKRATIDQNGHGITIDIEGAEHSEILDHFDIFDILRCFEIGEILDVIGQDECISHFGIEVKED